MTNHLYGLLPFFLITLTTLLGCTQQTATKHGLAPDDVAWVKAATIEQLQGCRVQGVGDIWLHTPDGVGNYKALWTRDFYYFVHYAGDLMDPREVKASIFYLLDGQRDDGCIPDRVQAGGRPVYSPGGPNNPLADHALDNGPFMALLLCTYCEQFGDLPTFTKAEPLVREGMDFTNLAANGLVYNDPADPQCVYGFTDIVQKTGHLLFTSLLYHDACTRMAALCEQAGVGDAEEYRRRAKKIEESISLLWDDEAGMFLAADIDCEQIDIWGSALAVYLDLTTQSQADRIGAYLIQHHDQLIQRGQLRHLAPEDDRWEKLFEDEPAGQYQNGAYWATPLAWVVPVYAEHHPETAKQILRAVVADFKANGINECINGDYTKVPNFVASATNVYTLTK